MKNTKDKNELKRIIFRPTWKEIIVCEYDNHKFVLEFSMGNLTFYLPKKEEWELIAPSWAKGIFDQLENESIDYCKNNNINFIKNEGHIFSFDDTKYQLLPKNGKGVFIENENYVIKSSDGKHEIFLKQELSIDFPEQKNHSIEIDNIKQEVTFSDSLIANDLLCENIFFGCIDKENNKRLAIYNFPRKKLFYIPKYLHNFYIENNFIKGFDDRKERIQYDYKKIIENV